MTTNRPLDTALPHVGKEEPSFAKHPKGKTVIVSTSAALVLGIATHLLPENHMAFPGCGHYEGIGKTPHQMLPTKEICNQLRPGPEIGYIAERIKRVRTLTVGQEERARNMGIPIDALSLKWKFDVDYILNAIKAHLSKEDTELFPIYLSMMRTIPDVNVLRAITLLQEGLEKGSDRKEILARIRFISSTAEKSLYGPKRGVEYSASAIQEEIGSSADGIIPFLHISSDPKAPSIFRNDAKHLVGMSSAEGKITRLSAVLGIDITDTVIDILRSKSQEEGRFVFELFYSRQRDLADFLDALEIAAIPHAHKHVRLTFTPINDMAADVSVLYPWIRDTGIAAFTKDGKTVIVRPQLHNSYGSGANMLAWRFQTDVTSIPLFLSGGNVQQDTDTLFIGWSEILINIPRIGLSAIRPQTDQSVSHIAPPTPEEIEKVVSVLKEKFSKKVVIVGRDEEGEQSGDNPFGLPHVYHLDMFFTALGDRRIALADNGSSWLGKVRKDLESKGYRVFAVPILAGGNSGQIAATYNNVIVENYPALDGKSIRRVYLPQYSQSTAEVEKVAALDARARDAWKKTGFEVIPVRMDIRNPLATGSLHCRIYELREPVVRHSAMR